MKLPDQLVNNFISIFNIPVQENWELYLKQDHMNYFEYMVNSDITDKKLCFDITNPATYKLTDNKGLRSYLNEKNHYFEFENIQEKVVVDVGCGWGFVAFWLLLNGAKEVVAIGFPYQILFIQRLLKAASAKNLLPKHGKIICVEKPLEKGNTELGNLGHAYADQVVYNDVFEHIPNEIFDDALIATYNTLKPGGKLVSSCHNTDNPSVMKRIAQYWETLENTRFREFRRNKILEIIPGISDDDLIQLVGQTRGMMLDEFNDALTEFQKRGIIPEMNSLRPAVDLSYNYICENYISPTRVLNKMKQTGFEVHSFPAIRNSRRYMPFWPVDKLLGPVFMKTDLLNSTVVFVGTKPY